jgi:hypothetical protein
MITYSAGLRANETARMKITDIDSKRMMDRMTQGKGSQHQDPKDKNIKIY